MNRIKWNVNFLAFFLILTVFIFVQPKASLAETDALLGFSYENILPKNQITDHTYFELKVKPGDEQTIETKVTNNTNKKTIIQVSLSDATTSPSGSINYGPSKEKLLGKKTPRLSEMVEAPTRVTLKAKETKKIKFHIKVPKKEFDGIVLGGVQLKELNKEDKNEKSKKNTDASIENEYSYMFSISLKENEKKIKPNISSSGSSYNGKAYTTVNNVSSMIASNVKIETVLMGNKSDKILDEFKFENYRIAPNSRLTLPLEGTEDLKLGKYKTKTTVTIGKSEWIFDETFEVTKENKKRKDVYFEDDSKESVISWLFIALIILSFIVTTAAIFYILNKKSKLKIKKKGSKSNRADEQDDRE